MRKRRVAVGHRGFEECEIFLLQSGVLQSRLDKNNVNFHFSVFVQHQQQKKDRVVCLGEFKDVSSHMD